MEEKQENNAVNISQESNNAPDTNSEPAPVLSIEERESKLAEREKALELSERKFFAKELITRNDMSEELLDFIDYTSNDTIKESVEKLKKILNDYHNKAGAQYTVNTGFSHGDPPRGNDNEFTRGLRSSAW